MPQTYRTDTKFIKDMPPLSKKRRYAKSAMSLVGRDIRSGLFKTLKAATLIVIEDEIENELSAHDMWQEIGRASCRERVFTPCRSQIMYTSTLNFTWCLHLCKLKFEKNNGTIRLQI